MATVLDSLDFQIDIIILLIIASLRFIIKGTSSSVWGHPAWIPEGKRFGLLGW